MSTGQPEGSGSGTPIVRHFIVCERINRSLDGRHYSLVNLIHTIQFPSGMTYPFIYPEMWVFAHLSDGRGIQFFQLRLFLLEEDETEAYSWKSIQKDLGQDPLEAQYLPMKVRDVAFSVPGLYEFRLLCDGREIAREPILLREAP